MERERRQWSGVHTAASYLYLYITSRATLLLILNPTTPTNLLVAARPRPTYNSIAPSCPTLPTHTQLFTPPSGWICSGSSYKHPSEKAVRLTHHMSPPFDGQQPRDPRPPQLAIPPRELTVPHQRQRAGSQPGDRSPIAPPSPGLAPGGGLTVGSGGAGDRRSASGAAASPKHTRTCQKCQNPLTGQFVRAIGGTFHLDCFKCMVMPSATLVRRLFCCSRWNLIPGLRRGSGLQVLPCG